MRRIRRYYRIWGPPSSGHYKGIYVCLCFQIFLSEINLLTPCKNATPQYKNQNRFVNTRFQPKTQSDNSH